MPLYYQLNNNKIEIKLDVLNYVKKYNSTLARGLNPLGELIIIGVVYNQTPPTNQMGLKEVTVGTNGKLIYSEPVITSSDKCVIFIHGWFSSPDTWEKFIPLFKTKSTSNYTKILTFGYNSSLPINDNGLILANILVTKFQGKKVDIVGHSMGGLVSRAAIENQNASQYVKNLVTLGTPHKGSPLAALRSLIGILVATDGIPEYIAFNLNTQGFNDLFPTSNFISTLNANPQSAVPYYAIAAENEPCNSYQTFLGVPFYSCWPTSAEFILSGNDDGVVAKSSALGIIVNNNIGLPTELFLPNFIAHIAMLQNEGFVNLVAGYLNQQSPTIPTSGLIAYYPFNGNANDLSGNNNNGTVNGATLTTDRKGIANSAYSFNGVSNYIMVPTSSTLESAQSSLTISAWININSMFISNGIGYFPILEKSNLLSQGGLYNLHLHSTLGIRTTLNGNYSNYQYTAPLNNWVHIVVVTSSNNTFYYVNGTNIGSSAMTFSGSISNTLPLIIGADIPGLAEYANGKIDDLRIYNRALNQNEITSLYQE